jgi:hypothetical protein
MTDTPNDDKLGFVAEESEHWFTCFRLLRPGQIYYLTIEHEVLCADCTLIEGVIRVRDGLVHCLRCCLARQVRSLEMTEDVGKTTQEDGMHPTRQHQIHSFDRAAHPVL